MANPLLRLSLRCLILEAKDNRRHVRRNFFADELLDDGRLANSHLSLNQQDAALGIGQEVFDFAEDKFSPDKIRWR